MPESAAVFQGAQQPRGFPGLPEGWVSEVETFPSELDGVKLFGVHYHPAQWTGSRALLVFHGLGEHGGRYLHFPHYLQETVDSVYLFDHRGHGRSEGLRGHLDRFSQVTDDAAQAIRHLDQKLRARFGRSEIHVMGHSFGGLVLLRTLLEHPGLPIRSATVSSPLLGIAVKLPLLKIGAARLLSRVWGSLQLDSEIHPDEVSHDKEVGIAYARDRLVHRKGTPRLYTEMTAAIARTMRGTTDEEKGGAPLSYPISFQIAMQDTIVNAQASLEFFRDLKATDKQIKTYPEFFHEIFNEIGKEKAFEDLKSWINRHKPS